VDDLIIDSFAGGGGASLGITWAIGRGPDIAINHDANAITMHEANHPDTYHVLEDVWKTDLKKLVGRRKVGLLWLSPTCTHFSRAKGGKPVENRVRSLAWIACKWAKEVKPRVIMLENVREFEQWGPLVPRYSCTSCEWRGTEGQAKLARVNIRCPRCNASRLKMTDDQFPDPKRAGLTFRRFVGRLRNLGYTVDWRVLNAADYGAPTHRRRLFLVARRDGEPITWPEPTHGNPETIDDTPLFERLKPWRTAAECIDWMIPCPSIFERKKQLAEATMRRIAMGIKRYVIESEKPFLVACNHAGEGFRGQAVEDPLCTVTSARDAIGLVSPILSKYHGQKLDESRCGELNRPIATLDTQPRFALVAPVLAQTGYGERAGQAPRAMSIENPLGTVVAGGTKVGLVSAFIAKHFGGMVGVEVTEPLPTTTAKGCQNQLVSANLVRFNFDDHGVNANAPMMTVTTNNHAALVYSFLVRYFGTSIGQRCSEPLYTATTKDRTALVTVQIDGEPYVIVDIGMRMLTPRELARAQGFPDTYILTGTKTSQVARIGNSVCPHVAAALVAANIPCAVGTAQGNDLGYRF
jgi:DNA (cytosine-5)-methyltransferase 1